MAEPGSTDAIKILLVDDDEDEYVLIRELLAGLTSQAQDREGKAAARYLIDWAPGYDEALQAHDRSSYDVYLVDYHLGERDGLELLRELKSRGCRAPLILLTGQGNYQLDLSAMQAGASDYLVKGRSDAPLLERSIRYALERQRSEEALQRANEELSRTSQRLHTILQVQPVAIWITDASGRIIEKNEMADRVWGGQAPLAGSVEEYGVYQGWWADTGEPLSPEDWALARAVRGETSISDIVDIRRFDGTRGTLLNSATPIYDEQGNISGAIGVSQDITHQRQVELQVRQRAEELNAVISAMTQAVIIYDAQGKVMQANPAAVLAYGVDPSQAGVEELLGRLSIRHINGQPVNIEELPSNRALHGETVRGERYIFTNAIGQDRIIIASASPILLDEKLAGVVAVWQDVTEREQLLAQLGREQARIRAIIANAPQAIVVVDERSRIVLANPLAEEIFARPIPYGEDYPAQAVLRMCYPDGTPYDPRNLPLTRSALDGETYSDLEIDIQLLDGQQRCLLVNTAPILDPQGKSSGAVGIFQDITARKQAEERARQSAARSELLARLSKGFTEAGLYYPAVLGTVVREIAEILGDACLIRILSDDGQWLDPVAFHHPNEEAHAPMRSLLAASRQRVDEGLAGRVFSTGQALHIPFVTRSEVRLQSQAEYWPKAVDYPVSSILIVPLQALGRQIGVLSVSRFRNFEPYSAEDLVFFEDLANRAALTIENARLFLVETQRARELDALHTATSALLTTLDMETLLGHILDAAMSAIPAAEDGALDLVDMGSGQLELRALRGFSLRRSRPLARPHSAVYPAASIKGRKPLLILDTRLDLAAGAGSETDFRAAIVAPLIQEDTVLGALTLTSSHPSAFTDGDLRLLVSFAAATSAAIQNAALHSEVQKQAITDTLTNLYNRRGFARLGQREFERTARFRHPMAVIMLDIDHFKQINDTYGHPTGDQVLSAIGRLLSQNLREGDILGRYGGEEFAILLPETDLVTSCSIAERLRSSVAAGPVDTEVGPISLTISLGVAAAAPSTPDLETLLQRADIALYEAKQSGRNRVEVS